MPHVVENYYNHHTLLFHNSDLVNGHCVYLWQSQIANKCIFYYTTFTGCALFVVNPAADDRVSEHHAQKDYSDIHACTDQNYLALDLGACKHGAIQFT